MKPKIINNKLISNLLNLDAMGQSVSLNLNGRDSYQTLIGTVFTLISLIICLFTVSDTIESFIYKSNPNVFTTSSYDDNSLRINNTNMKLFIIFFNYDTPTTISTPISKSELDYYPRYFHMTSNSTGVYQYSDAMSMVDCDNSIFGDYNTGFISPKAYLDAGTIEYIKMFSYCLPDSEHVIDNNLQENTFLTISFILSSFKQLSKKYPNMMVQVNYRTVLLNPENFKSPSNLAWKQFVFTLKLDKIELYKLLVESYHIDKDQSVFLFSDEPNYTLVNGIEVSQLGSLEEKPKDNDSFVSLSIMKSDLATTTKIKYKSLNDVISDFGGSFGVLFPMLRLLIQIITTPLYRNTLLASVFRFYEPEDKEYGRIFKSILLSRCKEPSVSRENYLNDFNGDKLVLINHNEYISSVDKLECKDEEFVTRSIEKIKKNRIINIRLYDYFKCRKSNISSLLMKKYNIMIEKDLDVTHVLSHVSKLDRLSRLLLNEVELDVISKSRINIDCNDKFAIGNEDTGKIIQYLLSLDYKESRNRQLLNEFILNNY
jgi:hypothetical protein